MSGPGGPSQARVLVYCLSVGALALFGLLALVSQDPVSDVATLLTGPLDRPGRITAWLRETSHLMLVGLAVAMAFRVRQFSLGAEGQLVLGALAGGIVALSVPAFSGLFVLCAVAASIVGFAWGAIPGLLKARWGADEIVSTLMLNYVGLLLFVYVVKRFLLPPEAGFIVSEYFPSQATMGTAGTIGAVAIPWSVALGVASCLAAALFFRRTILGFQMRMTGFSPRFANSVGFNTYRATWLSIAISGGVAGLGGMVIADGTSGRLLMGFSGGIGYEGIFVSLLAANNPLYIPLAAASYGYLRVGANVLESSSSLPRELVIVVQALLIILVTVRRFPSLLRRRKPSESATEPREVATATEAAH